MSFSVHSQYVVNHPFRYQGRDWRRGEPFDVRMNPRQCRLLYEQRKIVHAGDYRGPAREPLSEQTVQVDADDVRADELEDVLREELAKPRATLTVKAKGNGWFDVVDAEGNPVNDKSLRQAEAEALAANAE